MADYDKVVTRIIAPCGCVYSYHWGRPEVGWFWSHSYAMARMGVGRG